MTTAFLMLAFVSTHGLSSESFMMARAESPVEIAKKRGEVLTPYIGEVSEPETLVLENQPDSQNVINWSNSGNNEGEANSDTFFPPFHMTLKSYNPGNTDDVRLKPALDTAISKVLFNIQDVKLYTSFFVLELSKSYVVKSGQTLSDVEQEALAYFLPRNPHVSLIRCIWKKGSELRAWENFFKPISPEEQKQKLIRSLQDGIASHMKSYMEIYKKIYKDNPFNMGDKLSLEIFCGLDNMLDNIKNLILSYLKESQYEEVKTLIKSCMTEGLRKSNTDAQDFFDQIDTLDDIRDVLDGYILYAMLEDDLRWPTKKKWAKLGNKNKFFKGIGELASQNTTAPSNEFKTSRIKSIQSWSDIQCGLENAFKNKSITFSGIEVASS